MVRIVRLLLVGALCARAAPAGAQCVETVVRTVQAHADSLIEETTRRSATTGRFLAPRATVVRKHAAAIFSAVPQCSPTPPVAPVEAVTVSFGMTTTSTIWPGGMRNVGVYETGDSAIVCAAIQLADTATRIGATYVVAKHVRHDSLTWREITPPTVGDLRESCRRSWEPQFGPIASRPPFAVQWVPLRVEPYTIAFPFARPASVP